MNNLSLKLIAVLAMMVGFAGHATADQDLHGSWQILTIDGQAPPIQMQLTFANNGTVTMTATAPGEQPIEMNGTYTAANGELTMAMPAGTEEDTVDYAIDDDSLTLSGADDEGVQHSMQLRRVAG